MRECIYSTRRSKGSWFTSRESFKIYCELWDSNWYQSYLRHFLGIFSLWHDLFVYVIQLLDSNRSPSEFDFSDSEILTTDLRDYDLGRTCAGYCDKDYEQCVDTCEFNKANDCLMNCGRIFTMCVESCPCHTDCIKGCEGCLNPICYCNVSCFNLKS